jgi:hypothetical protein
MTQAAAVPNSFFTFVFLSCETAAPTGACHVDDAQSLARPSAEHEPRRMATAPQPERTDGAAPDVRTTAAPAGSVLPVEKTDPELG